MSSESRGTWTAVNFECVESKGNRVCLIWAQLLFVIWARASKNFLCGLSGLLPPRLVCSLSRVCFVQIESFLFTLENIFFFASVFSVCASAIWNAMKFNIFLCVVSWIETKLNHFTACFCLFFYKKFQMFSFFFCSCVLFFSLSLVLASSCSGTFRLLLLLMM